MSDPRSYIDIPSSYMDTSSGSEQEWDTNSETESETESEIESETDSKGSEDLEEQEGSLMPEKEGAEGGEGTLRTSAGDAMEISQGAELNRGEIDGLFCPICGEPWTTEGDHHVCCLPCGHIFGYKCIQGWLERFHKKYCPQCNATCTSNHVRKLFASRVVAVEEELLKRIQSVEDKCLVLELKNAEWQKKEAEWKKREALLQLELQVFKEIRTPIHRTLIPVDPNPRFPGQVQNVATNPLTDAVADVQKAETLSFWRREVRFHDAAIAYNQAYIAYYQAAKERALAFIARVVAS